MEGFGPSIRSTLAVKYDYHFYPPVVHHYGGSGRDSTVSHQEGIAFLRLPMGILDPLPKFSAEKRNYDLY